MHKAISNIAWTKEEDEKMYPIMTQYGFQGLEIAPSRIWADPTHVSQNSIRDFQNKLHEYQITVIAMQAILFGKQELTIFENPEIKLKTSQYIKKTIDLASNLDVQILVFGSPKNRLTYGKDKTEIDKISIEFFNMIGDYAKSKNTLFCIEPNPPEYGADFITNVSEAISLVKNVNNSGFRLHLDLGAMTINKEDYVKCITSSKPFLSHFHISEPYLHPISETESKHEIVDDALKNINYQGWVSIEMKSNNVGNNIQTVTQAMQIVSKYY